MVLVPIFIKILFKHRQFPRRKFTFVLKSQWKCGNNL